VNDLGLVDAGQVEVESLVAVREAFVLDAE
jgi:hypothetical protein